MSDAAKDVVRFVQHQLGDCRGHIVSFRQLPRAGRCLDVIYVVDPSGSDGRVFAGNSQNVAVLQLNFGSREAIKNRLDQIKALIANRRLNRVDAKRLWHQKYFLLAVRNRAQSYHNTRLLSAKSDQARVANWLQLPESERDLAHVAQGRSRARRD